MSYTPDDHDPDLPRCGWVPPTDGFYCHYHDTEWGIPNYDSKSLFSKLIQDGMQAGLSWITILRKREEILRAFDGLDPDMIAHYTDDDRERLLADAGIIRSKLKINAAITNAQIYRKMRDEEGIDFSEYLWGFVGGKPIQNTWKEFKDAPVKSPESEALAKDLKKRGYKFTGPVIIYAFMQAVGMINDHAIDCHAYERCKNYEKP
ncbi:MAG: DNA-3-methyladenine glycosylase I [Robiginitomaculum sp.]|nr:MAG: DNA-3-methyladenine glycosylase I [Robiginitomaculum sp.]